MKQQTFSDIEYSNRRRKTKRDIVAQLSRQKSKIFIMN